MDIKLNNNKGFKWCSNEKYSYKGSFFIKGRLFNSNTKDCLEPELDYIMENPKELRGVFIIIIIKKDVIFVITDNVRSFPLYIVNTNHFFITDDVNEFSEFEIKKNLVDEFKCLGYITGKQTLLKGIYQLGAAEIIEISKKTNEITDVNEYFIFNPPRLDSMDDISKQKLHDIHTSAIIRLINSVGNRQIVIPLSSGYDSRLILQLLLENNFKNIITFTYGSEKNNEVEKSKMVANKLGVKWFFMRTESSDWKKFKQTESIFNQYLDYSFDYTHVPHIQDLLAVFKLKNNKYVDEDAIFVPGHSYDAIVGSHLTENVLNSNLNNDHIGDLIDFHYSLRDNTFGKKKLKKNINSKIIEISNNYSDINYYDYFDWKERQSKFIVSSLKVYNFFDHEWRMPLWDQEIIEFWNKIGINKRYRRHFFIEYYNNYFENPLTNQRGKLKSSKIKKLIPKVIKRRLAAYRDIYTNDFGWYGIMDFGSKIRFILRAGININSYLTIKILKKTKRRGLK